VTASTWDAIETGWLGSALLGIASELAAETAGVPVESVRAGLFEQVSEEEAGAAAASQLVAVLCPTILRAIELERARMRARSRGGWRWRLYAIEAAWRLRREAASVRRMVDRVLDVEVQRLLELFVTRATR
jgi:hypothetical protein